MQSCRNGYSKKEVRIKHLNQGGDTMSKSLIRAVELIKEECSKHENCIECFYSCIDEEGFTGCIVDSYGVSPEKWNLSRLGKKND